jgi:LysM repeat protein
MNTPNPLVPQGSLLEQKAKGKPHLRIAIFIVAIHVVFLGGLLIQGCKKEEPKTPANVDGTAGGSSTVAPPDASQPAVGISGNLNNDPYGSPIAPSNALPLASTSAPPSLLPALPQDTLPVPGGMASQTVPPLAPASGGTIEHVVEKGDSFYSLAKKYNVSMKAIAAANPSVDSGRLKLKQKLTIPAAAPKTDAAPAPGPMGAAAAPSETASPNTEKSYKVKPNDNLSKIARAHGVTVRELQTANRLKTTQIKVGDKLVIPPAKGKVASAETAALTAPAPAPVAPAFTSPAPAIPAPSLPGTLPAGTNR